MLDAAAAQGMFVLLEAFDETDLRTAREMLALRARAAEPGLLLIGINCRDLQTLEVVQERFEALAPLLAGGLPAVAESGVATGSRCAAHAAAWDIALALIGTALMTRDDPSVLLREIFAATRTVQP